MPDELSHILKCCQLIEEQLGWGTSERWKEQDFEDLGEKIFKKTQISLSVSTLKRIWGKIQYKSKPNLATLNALAQFAGYENWRAFTSSGFQPSTTNSETDKTTLTRSLPSKLAIKVLWTCFLLICAAFTLYFLVFAEKMKPLIFKNIHFSSSPVTLGLPNSVIFKYDAADSNADSVFIQQNWDDRRRYKVDKLAHEFVSTYYLPGYFRAKLILNDSVVKEHDLLIETDGWLGTIDKEPIPVYFPENRLENNGILSISSPYLGKQRNNSEKEVQWVSLFNIEKDKSVSGINFTLRTEIKNTFGKGDGICQQTQILLLGTDGITMLPLSIKGCVGELNLVIANELFKGTTKDLSGFGVDFNYWVKVTCEVNSNYIKIYINDLLAFEGKQKADIGKIVGTRIRFMGGGSVRNFELTENK